MLTGLREVGGVRGGEARSGRWAGPVARGAHTTVGEVGGIRSAQRRGSREVSGVWGTRAAMGGERGLGHACGYGR